MWEGGEGCFNPGCFRWKYQKVSVELQSSWPIAKVSKKLKNTKIIFNYQLFLEI